MGQQARVLPCVTNWRDGHAWHWANQGKTASATVTAPVGVITVTDTPASSERPYSFVKGSNGHLWVNWWDGAAWHWADQGAATGGNIAAGVGALTVMDTPHSYQRPYAFATAADGNLWVDWWS